MTCDICGPRMAQIGKTKGVGRDPQGRPISCRMLECGHAWHIVAGANLNPICCDCPDYVPPSN
jgi:hypothetical protein